VEDGLDGLIELFDEIQGANRSGGSSWMVGNGLKTEGGHVEWGGGGSEQIRMLVKKTEKGHRPRWGTPFRHHQLRVLKQTWSRCR
jgi:hypothetical protein